MLIMVTDIDISNVEVSRSVSLDFATYLQTRHVIHTRKFYQQLQAGLVEYIWKRYNHNN